MKNRTNKILELLTSEKRIEVSQLAEYLGVSQVTIRKDLDALEAKGIIKREHGHAVLCSTDDINGRIAYHYEEKKKIALKATELVHEGDTIMIESGSCCALLADTLTQLHKDLTIITNSAFIEEYIRGKSNYSFRWNLSTRFTSYGRSNGSRMCIQLFCRLFFHRYRWI